MKIRIATWNMAYWQHKKLHAEAWDYLLDKIDADIYLFQEGRPTDSLLHQKNHLVWSDIGGKRNWGSGIYSNKYVIHEETVETQFKGVFSIGDAIVGDKKLTLISMYGLMENSGPTKGYCIPNLHRMLSDLSGLFYGFIDGKRIIVMGGDLNASTQIDERQKNRSHAILFDRIADFGLKDIYKLSGNKSHVQTLRHTRSNVPWQNDYFFISDSLVKRFVKYELVDNPELRQFSDHNPVIIEINI